MNIFNPKNSNQLLIYVNPGFTGVHGYYKNHATKFMAAVDSADVALLHLTHVDLQLDLAVRYRASLAYTERPHLTLSGDSEVHKRISDEFYHKMQEVFQRSDVTSFSNISLYMYSGHPLYAATLSRVFSKLKLGVRAYVNILYNEKELEHLKRSSDLAKKLKEWGEVLNANDKEGNIMIAVDCPLARDLYLDLLGRTVKLLPAGCALPRGYSDVIRDKIRLTFRNKRLNVLYMGYSHRKYGYKLVKELYDQTKDLKLHFHIRHQDAHLQSDHKEVREDWLKQNENIDHYTGFIDEKKYNHLIRKSDIIIIPYLKEEYPYQTSGVFIEALSANKVIVATKGTWFGGVVEKLGVGEVFESNNPESLNEAMRKVVNDYYQIKKRAIFHGARYRAFWSMDNLFSFLGIIDQNKKIRLIDDIY